MARRVVDPYPPLDAIARTLRKQRAHLAGTRRFYAGEGLIAFADNKRGLSEIAGETYLPPDRYRQLANFLDQNATPFVVGFRCTPIEPPSEPLPELALTPLQRFIGAAGTTLHEQFTDEGREITLRAAEASALAGWDWQAELQYEHYYTLDGGIRIPEEATLRLYARAHGEDVDVAVIVAQSSDREVAVAWLNKLMARRWLPQNVVLPLQDAERKAALRAICAQFGIRLSGLRSPDVYASRSTERPSDGFLSVMQRAAYETAVTDLDTVLARADDDAGTLGGVTVALWERSQKAITSVDVRQRPTESFVRVAWKGGRAHENSDLDLSDRWWETATPVDWSTEQKQLYLLGVWQDVVAGIDGASAAATAAAIA